MTYVPERGDVVWADFNPQLGHEQAGRRLALILSPAFYNHRTGLVLLCPITNQVKGFKFEVIIPAGLPVSGAVLSDAVKNFDWRARRCTFLTTMPPSVTEDVLEKLRTLL